MSDTIVPGKRNVRVYKDGEPGEWTQPDSSSQGAPTKHAVVDEKGETHVETPAETADRLSANRSNQSTDAQNGYA